MRSWKIELAAAFLASAVAGCTSDFGLHTMNCGSDAFDTLAECKDAMLARGYSDSQAEIDAAAASCCELTQDHHETSGTSDCYPLKEASECLGNTDPNSKGDAGGGGSDSLVVIGGNLTAVGASLDAAASLSSGREEMATEEVRDETTPAGESAAATAQSKSPTSEAARRRGDGTAGNGFTTGVLDFRAPPSGGAKSTGTGALSGGSGGGSNLFEDSDRESLAARGREQNNGNSGGLIPTLQGGRSSGGSGGNQNSALPPGGVGSLDFEKREESPTDVPPMGSEEPADYFERIPPHESLFKRIERKIDQKERFWMIQEPLR